MRDHLLYKLNDSMIKSEMKGGPPPDHSISAPTDVTLGVLAREGLGWSGGQRRGERELPSGPGSAGRDKRAPSAEKCPSLWVERELCSLLVCY